jgi:hypothetical protein
VIIIVACIYDRKVQVKVGKGVVRDPGCFTVRGPTWLHNFAKVGTKVDCQVGPKLGYREMPYCF